MTRQENVAIFIDLYRDTLVEAVQKFPDQYAWPVEEAPIVVERMRLAFEKGGYNHDGYAIKAACKRLGIKHTRKALEAFFNEGVANG